MTTSVKHNIDFYNLHANDLLAQYESTSFSEVHADWLHLLPKKGEVLDIGAGSGRDCAYMASHGLHAFAVEPAATFRALASTTHPHPNITWLDDTLPTLAGTTCLNIKFDLILLSAVWMHLSKPERKNALNTLCGLLKPYATIIITLRHGNPSDERLMYPVSVDEIQALLDETNFTCTLLTKQKNNADTLGRKQVSWQTVQIRMKE